MKTPNASTWALLLSVLVFASCGQNPGPSSSQLDGRWKCGQIDGEEAGAISTEYIFEGKKLTIKQGGFERRGDLSKMTGNTFSFKYEGGQAEVVFGYRFKGGSLVLEPRAEGGQPLTFQRQ